MQASPQEILLTREVTIFYGIKSRLTFAARDWLKTCHDNAALKWVSQLRFKFHDQDYSNESLLISNLLPFARFRQLLLHTRSSLRAIYGYIEFYAGDEGR